MLRTLVLLVAVAGASAVGTAGGSPRPRSGQVLRRSSAPALALAALPGKLGECAVKGDEEVLRMRGGGKQTVLVTGGAGYIGTHTAVALQEAGYEVLLASNSRFRSFSSFDPQLCHQCRLPLRARLRADPSLFLHVFRGAVG